MQKRSKVKLIFCTNECEEETIEETKLKDLCDNMYFYLSHASDCVDICAKNEKKTGKNTIYYEGSCGYNVGAQQLRRDINRFLNNYYKERVQIDIGASRKEFEDRKE